MGGYLSNCAFSNMQMFPLQTNFGKMLAFNGENERSVKIWSFCFSDAEDFVLNLNPHNLFYTLFIMPLKSILALESMRKFFSRHFFARWLHQLSHVT
jgi:hypothetical protein